MTNALYPRSSKQTTFLMETVTFLGCIGLAKQLNAKIWRFTYKQNQYITFLIFYIVKAVSVANSINKTTKSSK